MSSRDVRIDASVRRVLRSLTSGGRSDVAEIIRDLAADPDPDERHKFTMSSGHLLYNDRTYWVLYTVLNDYTIAIMGVGTN